MRRFQFAQTVLTRVLHGLAALWLAVFLSLGAMPVAEPQPANPMAPDLYSAIISPAVGAGPRLPGEGGTVTPLASHEPAGDPAFAGGEHHSPGGAMRGSGPQAMAWRQGPFSGCPRANAIRAPPLA